MKKITVDSKWVVLGLRILATGILAIFADIFIIEKNDLVTTGIAILVLGIIALAVWSKPDRRIMRWLATVLIALFFVALVFSAINVQYPGDSSIASDANFSAYSGFFFWLIGVLIAIWLPVRFDRIKVVKPEGDMSANS